MLFNEKATICELRQLCAIMRSGNVKANWPQCALLISACYAIHLAETKLTSELPKKNAVYCKRRPI